MKLAFGQLLWFFAGAAAYFFALYFVDRSLRGRSRIVFRYAAVLLSIGAFFYALQTWLPVTHDRAQNVSQAAIAIAAAACIFYEQHRNSQNRPIAERWKKLVGITLALAAISAYFGGFRFGYPPYYHRWDQYHYYMGAKYFPELGYKNLYRCAVVAQLDLGDVKYSTDRTFSATPGKAAAPPSVQTADMKAEVEGPDKKIRNLPGDNLLVPVTDLLDHPEKCRDLFTPERWEQYKKDVAFFRIVAGKSWWNDMQTDHGFNPPPVWTIGGKFFSDLTENANVLFMQFLASLDLLYLIATFIVLWWGFGWRVFAVGAIFWGCQTSAPYFWTGGAFLRQDWLFFSVASVAFLRKRYFKLAGASVVYAGLLRIFPGLVVIGTLVPVVTHIIKKRKMHPDHRQTLIGGVAAAAVLLPLSLYMTKAHAGEPFYTPYKIFYEHTIQTHDRTPLTNHMGLRVIIAHKLIDFQAPGVRTSEDAAAWKETLSPTARTFIGWSARIRMPFKLPNDKSSGWMEHVRAGDRLDPWEIWKKMRTERYEKYRWVAWLITALTLGWFALVVRRIRSLWIAQCLGQIFIILGSQLTSYYYAFMLLAAPLTRVRKQLELGLFALAAITDIIWLNTTWNDHRYTWLTIVSLAFCYLMIGTFWRVRWRRHAEAQEVKSTPEEEEEEEDSQEEEEPAPARS